MMKSFHVNGEPVSVSGQALSGQGLEHTYRVTLNADTFELEARALADGRLDLRLPDGSRALVSVVAQGTSVWLCGQGLNVELREVRAGTSRGHEAEGSLEAPMPGKVVQIKVAVGDLVEKGATLLTVEAMKMEHALKAPKRGVVETIPVSVGELVSPGRALITLKEVEA